MKYSLGADVDGVFSIDVDSFSPGPHTLNITATSSDGEVDTAFISFVISATIGEIASQFFSMNLTIYLKYCSCRFNMWYFSSAW